MGKKAKKDKAGTDVVAMKAASVKSLAAGTPDGVVRDADTVLKDVMDAADFEITGLASEIIDIWLAAKDRGAAAAMFQAVSGVGFEEFLDRCLETTSRGPGIGKDNIVRAERVLADNGIEPDECPVVLQAIGYALLDRELYPE